MQTPTRTIEDRRAASLGAQLAHVWGLTWGVPREHRGGSPSSQACSPARRPDREQRPSPPGSQGRPRCRRGCRGHTADHRGGSRCHRPMPWGAEPRTSFHCGQRGTRPTWRGNGDFTGSGGRAGLDEGQPALQRARGGSQLLGRGGGGAVGWEPCASGSLNPEVPAKSFTGMGRGEPLLTWAQEPITRPPGIGSTLTCSILLSPPLPPAPGAGSPRGQLLRRPEG